MLLSFKSCYGTKQYVYVTCKDIDQGDLVTPIPSTQSPTQCDITSSTLGGTQVLSKQYTYRPTPDKNADLHIIW